MSKKKFTFALVFVVAVVIVWMMVRPSNGAPMYEPAVVERGEVTHMVSVTGHVEPVTRVNLAFPVGGRVTAFPVEEGTPVLDGTVVGVLDGGILQSSLREAELAVEREKAVLRDLTAPLRSEERAVKSTAVANAELALARAEDAARTAIAKAFVYADSAVHEDADELFENDKFGVTFTYGTIAYRLQADAATESTINLKKKEVEAVLEALDGRSDSTAADVDILLSQTDADLVVVEDFLTDLAKVVNRYTSDDSINQTVYESFQTAVASARTSVNTARSEISAAHTALSSAESSLMLAQSNLDLSEAGASEDSIAAQRASVASAMAAVGTAEERAKDTVLTVPFDGILSRINFEIGEIVSAYEPVAELITEGVFEVEAYIPEADIARVKLGDTAKVTFDAYEQSDVFTATVVRIAVSETYKEGVPTYKTTLRIDDADRENITLRPGMTADIDILTDTREDTLFIPVRSVLTENGRTYVRIYQNGEFVEKDIETGLRGSEGTVEVTGGLEEDDEVVLYVEEE